MTKRIYWKRGMRLTDEILRSSDKCHLESLAQAFVLAANGRFGLLPSERDFKISINVDAAKGVVDVVQLSCLAITKSGVLFDINYDTRYSNNFNTKVAMPANSGGKCFLCVEDTGSWNEVPGSFYGEPDYKFTIIQENRAIASNMFPVACLVNEDGWHLDENDFLPPCLSINSLPVYVRYVEMFMDFLKATSRHLANRLNSDCKTAIGMLLPIVEQLKITMDKDVELMTPMMLLGNIQKYICGFLCACTLDDKLGQTDLEVFRNFIETPYNYKNVSRHIKDGLNLCRSICETVEGFKTVARVEAKIEAPTISSADLVKRCTRGNVRIPVENNAPGSTIYYTVDGSEPTSASSTGNAVVMSSGFGGRGKVEDDRYVVVKVKAILNGVSSATNTYKIRLQKDVAHWIEI